MKKYWHFAFGFFLIFAVGEAQETFTKQDTLRGSITKERVWWDVTYYHLDIKVNDPRGKRVKLSKGRKCFFY